MANPAIPLVLYADKSTKSERDILIAEGDVDDHEANTIATAQLPLLSEDEFRSAPQRRIRLMSVLLLAVLPIVVVGGLTVLFLLWFLFHLYIPRSQIWSDQAFLLDEGSDGQKAQLRGLTISSVMSQAVSLVSPFALSLFAYRVATEWIQCQAHYTASPLGQKPARRAKRLLPNPYEYGLIVQLASSPSLISLYTSGSRIVTPKSRSPHTLWSAFLFALYVFGIVHLIGLCDLWLHTTTTTVIANTSLPLTEPFLYGVGFNHSLCPDGALDSTSNLPCLTTSGAWAADTRFIQTNAFTISSNSSQLSNGFVLPAVQTLADADNMAIAVSNSINTSYSFNASTFGVRAVCQNLVPQCHVAIGLSQASISNCSGAGYPQLPFPFSGENDYQIDDGLIVAQLGSLSAGLLSGGTDLPTVSANHTAPYPNPVPLLLQIPWSTYTTAGVVPVFEPSCDAIGPWVSNEDGGPNEGLGSLIVISACNMTWYNITISQLNGEYTLVKEQVSDPTFAAALWSPLLYQLATQHLENYLQSLALNQNNSDTLMTILGAELARQAMSFAAAMFEPTETIEQSLVGIKLLGSYPIAPVLTMVALLGMFTVITVLLSVWTIIGSTSPVVLQTPDDKDGPTVAELTQLRLTTPLALAAQVFSKDPASTLKPNAEDSFGDETEDTAVGIGLVRRGGKRAFEVHDMADER